MSYFKKTQNIGFTLTELIVVVAIATVLMTALVFQQSKWNDKLSVSTQTYEMGLMFRQAQVFGLGVREYMSGSGDKFGQGYGLHVDIGTTDRYIFFADRNNNQKFDSGEAIETKVFSKGVNINRICGYVSNSQTCSPSNGLHKVSVVFVRPEPKAALFFQNNGGNQLNSFGPPFDVYVRSANGSENSIRVNTNGYISITN